MNLFKAAFIHYPGPAFLGSSAACSRRGSTTYISVSVGGLFLFIVILACASMYCVNHWIPAFAGMTTEGKMGLSPSLQLLCYS